MTKRLQKYVRADSRGGHREVLGRFGQGSGQTLEAPYRSGRVILVLSMEHS